MKPIKRDIFMKNGLNGLSYRFVGGFHFSDIIGYGLADDTPTCVAACLALRRQNMYLEPMVKVNECRLAQQHGIKQVVLE
uniref:Uncharacterized protein n=1 Tax=Romanomermis culicivorax TaxID=13658 RepID=A0A915ILJ1_ROMCU